MADNTYHCDCGVVESFSGSDAPSRCGTCGRPVDVRKIRRPAKLSPVPANLAPVYGAASAPASAPAGDAPALRDRQLGGPGSGDFGHSGRPGQRGGSGTTANYKAVRHSTYGSHQWTVVHNDVTDPKEYLHKAEWLRQPAEQTADLQSRGISSDNHIRFFKTKRDAHAALHRTHGDSTQ